MSITRIKCFIEVAKRMSFTEAAEKLYMSQPSISRNISALEEEWGIELFSRKNKRKEIYLTPAGQLIANGLIELQEQFDDLLRQAKKIDKGSIGSIRLGLVDGDCIDKHILDAMEKFHQLQPEVNTSFKRGSYGEIADWLDQGKVDCCVYPEFIMSNVPEVDWAPLFQLDSLLILSKHHPLSANHPRSLKDCAEWTFISLEANESPTHVSYLVNECEKAGFIPKILLVPNVKEQQLLLESGEGIMIGSSNNIYVEQKHIMTILLDDLKPINQVLVWRKDSYNPCIRILHELIT